jgi:hypothetical protein
MTMNVVSHVNGRLQLRVSDNAVLRRIFRHEVGTVTGSLRKLQNEELRNYYPSAYIIRMIKSKKNGWVKLWHAWDRREVHTNL